MEWLRIIILLSILQYVTSFHLNDEQLSDFGHRLDMTGIDVVNNAFTARNNRAKRSQENVDASNHGNHREITDESNIHHRVRRSSIVQDMVKASRKTGNREELDLRSSVPVKNLHDIHEANDIVSIEINYGIENVRFFAIANHQSEMGDYFSQVIILRYNESSEVFSFHQAISEYAPYELEAFRGQLEAFQGQTVPPPDKHFLAVAGYVETGKHPTKLSVYEIGPGPDYFFVKIQEFPYSNIRSLSHIQISQTTYLIIGFYYQDIGQNRYYVSPSSIIMMRYDTPSGMFHFHSSLPGSGVVDIECFSARQKSYMVVANYQDNGGSLDIFSYVYIYNDIMRGFELRHALATHGARDIEHFILANEDYVVIANEASGFANQKQFGVPSSVYKLHNEKLELIQSLETYGATEWKYLPVPNCKQDVLLIYADQRDNIDQVGVYSFSHDQESFSAVPFSIFHLDSVNSTYRPQPLSLATYSTQDHITGEYNLFVIIGSNATTSQNNIYRLSYAIVLSDSPLDAFERDVLDQIKELNDTINQIKDLLDLAKDTLADAVTKDNEQVITGTKTFQTLMLSDGNINIMNISKGSLLYYGNNQTYRADPKLVPHVFDVGDLESNVSRHNTTITAVLDNQSSLMYANGYQNISSSMSFEFVTVKDMNANGDVTLSSGFINNVNLTYLFHDVVRKDEPAVITGTKRFSAITHLHGNVSVNGFLNDIKFNRDLVVNGTSQNITASKLLTNNVRVTKNIHSGSINGFRIPEDGLSIKETSVINRATTFVKDVSADNVIAKQLVNSLNITDVFADRVTKTSLQNITGFKSLASVTSNGNVRVNGLINGVDISDLANKVADSSNSSIVFGKKIFIGNITILGDLQVDEFINNIKFPENVVLQYSTQNIFANKIFDGSVRFLNDVNVTGTVDGLKIADLVTLNGIETLTGKKIFSETLHIDGDVAVPNGTVNEIDISAFVNTHLTVTGNQSIDTLSFSNELTLHQSKIQGSINKDDTLSSLQILLRDSLQSEGDQNITGLKNITSNVLVQHNLDSESINGFKFPDEFARLNSSQTFTANKIFSNDVSIYGLKSEGTINNINIDAFFKNVIYRDGNITIAGHKKFLGDVTIKQNAYIGMNLNKIDISEDVMFLTTNQTITSMKSFDYMKFPTVTMMKNLGVETTIDDVDLSDLDLSGMTVSRNETVTGAMCFEKTDYNKSVQYVNGIDLSVLRDDIVTLNTAQFITSEKDFTSINIKGNLNTSSTIDGIDVSELAKSTVYYNQDSTVTGNVTFTKNVSFLKNLSTSLLDNINTTSIQEEFIMKSRNETMHNLTITGNVTVNNLIAENINDVNLSTDIVYKSKNQTVNGFKSFANITSNSIIIHGLLNRVNLTSFANEAVYIDKDDIISGEKTFLEDVNINADLTSTGLVNGFNLSNLNVARTEGIPSQTISDKKTFAESVTLSELITAKMHGKTVDAIFTNAAMVNKNEEINGYITFNSGIEVNNKLNVTQNLSLIGNINNISITELNANVLKTKGAQNMSSKSIQGNLFISTLTVNRINGINVETDLMTKQTDQIIHGKKIFAYIELMDDAVVQNLTNGVNLTELLINSLLINATSANQIITGQKIFHDDVSFTKVTSNNLIDGINIQPGVFVTLNTSQFLIGTRTFTENFVCENLIVNGLVADVDLQLLNRTRVLTYGNQEINTDVTFKNNVNVFENVEITGYVNDIDLSTFNQQSPTLDEEELDALEENVTQTLSRQCDSLTYIKDSLQGSPFRFDHFMSHQKLPYKNIRHIEYFMINESSYLGLSISSTGGSYCSNSVIMKWNNTSSTATEYQVIPTADARKMKFIQTSWNSLYLLVINNVDGCNEVTGPSQLFQWDSSSNNFQFYMSLASINAVDADIFNDDTNTYIYVSNTNNTLTTWLLNPSGLQNIFIHPMLPTRIYKFDADENNYLAIGSRFSTDSSRGFVEINTINNGNLTRVQSIPCRGASSITTFTINQDTYLVVANDKDFTSEGHSTYNVVVEIYIQSSVTKRFRWFQSIPTHFAVHVSTFQVGSSIYLAITSYARSITTFKFEYELGFQEMNIIKRDGVEGAMFFRTGYKDYMAISIEGGWSEIFNFYSIGADPERVGMVNYC